MSDLESSVQKNHCLKTTSAGHISHLYYGTYEALYGADFFKQIGSYD